MTAIGQSGFCEKRFRLSRAELDAVATKYDWVLNARRSLLHVKLEKPLAEFQAIVSEVAIGMDRSHRAHREIRRDRP